MPHKPYWFRELDTITRTIEAFEQPLLDRRTVQMVFNVSQTEAGRLMRRMGCCYVGQSKAVVRGVALDWLRKTKAGAGYDMEMHRVERLQTKLTANRPVFFLPARTANLAATIDLPANIQLTAGRLLVDFTGAEELLMALQSLSQAAARDWPGFQAACGEKGRRK